MPIDRGERRLKREVTRTGEFKDDLKREKRGQHRKTLLTDLEAAIEKLGNDIPLPVAMRDHALTGNWKGTRDCHIHPDLVLIYRKIDPKPAKAPRRPDAPVLQLIRLGSHSELGL